MTSNDKAGVSEDFRDRVVRLLERYGRALGAVDVDTIASCWEVPALVLADQGAIAVTDPAEISAFFGQAAAAYRSQGLMSTRPELERVEMLSDTLAAVDARWPAFDASGNEQSSERSHYIVQRGSDGEMRIRVALTRTV